MNNVICSGQGGSPFRCYPSEQLVPAAAASPSQIRLSDLDRLVLGVINRVLIVTSLLLYRYLEAAGLRNTTMEDIRGCLRRLSDNGYLNRMRFRTPDGQSNLQVYTLTEHGRNAVRSTGRTALRAGYLDRMDSIHAKRQLAALQFVIGQGYVPDAASTSYGRLVRDLGDTTGSHLFRPQAVVQTRGKTVYVEAVRDHNGASEELVRKLKRIQATLAAGNPLNLGATGDFEVVIVAESHPHMTRLMQGADAAVPADLRSRLFFTNDQDTFCRSRKLYPLPEKRPFGSRLSEKLAGLLGF